MRPEESGDRSVFLCQTLGDVLLHTIPPLTVAFPLSHLQDSSGMYM